MERVHNKRKKDFLPSVYPHGTIGMKFSSLHTISFTNTVDNGIEVFLELLEAQSAFYRPKLFKFLHHRKARVTSALWSISYSTLKCSRYNLGKWFVQTGRQFAVQYQNSWMRTFFCSSIFMYNYGYTKWNDLVSLQLLWRTLSDDFIAGENSVYVLWQRQLEGKSNQSNPDGAFPQKKSFSSKPGYNWTGTLIGSEIWISLGSNSKSWKN